MDGDSPLSLTSNIIGLLTFVVAIIAGSYARALTFQAKLRYRDEILKAILDTMGAFSETCTLVIGYDNLKNTAYMPHDEFDEMLVNLYMSIFELMAVFLDLACKTSVSAARTVSKNSTRWKNKASEIEAQLSKVRQIYFFARLQDNILGRPRSNSSLSQNMRTTPTEGRDELQGNKESTAMPTINIQNALEPDESNANMKGPLRLENLMNLAWNKLCHERSDTWQSRRQLSNEIWDYSLSNSPQSMFPTVLCMAVIQSITPRGHQKLQEFSENMRQTPLTADTEAQQTQKARHEYPSRNENSYLVALTSYGSSIFKKGLHTAGVCAIFVVLFFRYNMAL